MTISEPFRLVFRYGELTVVYQDEPVGRVARVFGTCEVLVVTPALQAAIDAELARLARKGEDA